MNRNAKIALMFAPLGIFFIGFGVLVHDLRHPRLENDQCRVLATGPEVKKQRLQGETLYAQSANEQNDVALACRKFGTRLLNDMALFQLDIAKGQEASLLRKRYRYLPDRWSVNIRTGKPAEKMPPPQNRG